MSNLPVKFLYSTMAGAPQLTNDWGAMTAVLDAVLVNGFNTQSVTSIAQSGGVAVANITGHGFIMDQVISISGANESEYNGEFRVTSLTTNSVTFSVPSNAPASASGTITMKTAPLNWQVVFTATNKRVYRSTNPLSNKPFLRVDNSLDPLYTSTFAKYAKVTMAENMTDIDTFIGARAPYDSNNPNKNEVATGSGTAVVNGWYKWYYAKVNNADATSPETFNRDWVIVGDDRGFYLFNETMTAARGRSQYCFTDFHSLKEVDAYNTLLVASDAYIAATGNIGYVNTHNLNMSLDYTGKVLMKDHTQVGTSIRASVTSLNTNNAQSISGYNTGIPYPNPPDYSLILHHIYLMQEGSKGFRGRLPGLMWVLNDQPYTDRTILENIAGYPGRKFLILPVMYSSYGNVSRFGLDITGPWW